MTDTVTELTTIEGIDMDTEVPCGVVNHDHPADALMRTVCPRCGKTRTGGICWPWWGFLALKTCGCRCGHAVPRDLMCHIVEVLR